ncbi:MAG: ABC transporter ATP-binding protein [Candidatus Contendobacter sp.]|nr:ABC transporter ATP-binding protein [Candidatus Contendobacter sp.]
MPEAVFRISQLRKHRASGGSAFCLEVPELIIEAGERLALVGVSGCGKSTLLDVLAMVSSVESAETFALAPPDQPSHDLLALWRNGALDALTALRRRYFGYVLQSGGLLGFLTARDNITLPRRWCELPEDGTVAQLAERLGLSKLLDRYPAALSMGERQRVAIARALAHRPSIVLADEPTASLDPLNADGVMDLFLTLAVEQEVTMIVASHDWARMERYGLRRIAPQLARTLHCDGEQVTARFARVDS